MSGGSEENSAPETYKWVVEDDIPEVVARMQAIREGSPDDADPLAPGPAAALEILEVFAKHRRIVDLLTLDPSPEAGTAPGFAPLDARVVLTLAALIRPVREAATLAVRQWEKENVSAGSRLTDQMLHDVTAQRTVAEVAEFIHECRIQQAGDLVNQILDAFVQTATSGRTNLDKALLFIKLRDWECHDDAAGLLRRALDPPGEDQTERAAGGAGDEVGVVGALRRFSPSEGIVEKWIDQRMGNPYREESTVKLVADLLGGETGGVEALAGHIGLRWQSRRLILLCEVLAKRRGSHLPLVRRSAAARSDQNSLAEIIEDWNASSPLAGSLRGLLADIVAGGTSAPAPRSAEFLDGLHQVLKNRGAPAKCREELRVAAAAHVGDRTGAEVASLLGGVSRRRLRRVAQLVNQHVTERLLTGAIDAAWVVSYLTEIPERRPADAAGLTFWALRELSEPTEPTVPGDALERLAPAVGDIAARLYCDRFASTTFELLERCLENDQWLDDAGVVAIAERVHDSAIPGDARWLKLLSATVGRWANTGRRDEVVAALARRGFDREAGAIITSVQ